MTPTPPTAPARFTIAELADVAAELLGRPWRSTSTRWWVRGEIKDGHGLSFTVGVDDEDSLYVCPDGYVYSSHTVFLDDVTAAVGITGAAEAVADAIRSAAARHASHETHE
jgi:hypothetical protein